MIEDILLCSSRNEAIKITGYPRNKGSKLVTKLLLDNGYKETYFSAKEIYERLPNNCKECNETIEFNKRVNIFCSSSCSASYTNRGKIKSEETKLLISNSVSNSEIFKEGIIRSSLTRINKNNKLAYLFTCKLCKEECIDYRNNTSRQYHSECWIEMLRLNPRIGRQFKSGIYKGFKCDSSWELAFVIYHLDEGIEIKRNQVGFPYIYEKKEHKYYPDFIIDNIYYEIKGFKSDRTNCKISYFPHKIEVIYKDRIQFYLDYCRNKYGVDFISLYESNIARFV